MLDDYTRMTPWQSCVNSWSSDSHACLMITRAWPLDSPMSTAHYIMISSVRRKNAHDIATSTVGRSCFNSWSRESHAYFIYCIHNLHMTLLISSVWCKNAHDIATSMVGRSCFNSWFRHFKGWHHDFNGRSVRYFNTEKSLVIKVRMTFSIWTASS